MSKLLVFYYTIEMMKMMEMTMEMSMFLFLVGEKCAMIFMCAVILWRKMVSYCLVFGIFFCVLFFSVHLVFVWFCCRFSFRFIWFFYLFLVDLKVNFSNSTYQGVNELQNKLNFFINCFVLWLFCHQCC